MMRSPSLQSFRVGLERRGLPYLLLAPAVLFMLIVHFIPMLTGLWLSLLRLNIRTFDEFVGAPFAGLRNYAYLLTDGQSPMRGQFLGALRNTILYTVAVNGIGLLLALGAALLITREFRGRGMARTLLLLPWVMPSYVVGILWYMMLQPDNGVINHILSDVLRLPIRPNWLVGAEWITLVAIVAPTVWRFFPGNMLLMAAGLGGISQDLYEAAEVDGANAWQRLRYITLPGLKPVLAVIILFGIIGTLYNFNIVVVMFGSGAGYAGAWGDVLITMIYRNTFGQLNFGLGAAASLLLLLLCVAMVVVWYRVFREELALR